MTRIGVLSDTHISDLKQGIPFLEGLVSRYLDDTQLILHAGDIVDPGVLQAFSGKTVHAVRGNMDPAIPGIPVRKIITVEGFRIGLIHGWGAPEGLEERVFREFQGQVVDCLIYGHSHLPACHRREGILMFNPGSPTDRRWAPYHSIGLLELDGQVRGKILRIE